MFGELKIIMELQAHKNDMDKIVEIFNRNREQMLKLKEKYPQWKSYIKPEVVDTLRQRGLPVD